MSRRAPGSRAGSPFAAGQHVAVELVCPQNHLLVRLGLPLDGDVLFHELPDPPSDIWFNGEQDNDTTWLTVSCTVCAAIPGMTAASPRKSVATFRAVLEVLRHRGVPTLRLTESQLDDVSHRIARGGML